MLVLATILNITGFFTNGAGNMLVGKLRRTQATSAKTGKRLNLLLGAVYVSLACRLVWLPGM